MLTFGLLLNSKYHHTIRLDRFVNKQKKTKTKLKLLNNQQKSYHDLRCGLCMTLVCLLNVSLFVLLEKIF